MVSVHVQGQFDNFLVETVDDLGQVVVIDHFELLEHVFILVADIEGKFLHQGLDGSSSMDVQ